MSKQLLVLLKDVELEDVAQTLVGYFGESAVSDARYYTDHEFSMGRGTQLKRLRAQNAADVVFCVYRFNYLRWSLAHLVVSYCSARRAWLLEANGTLVRISSWRLIGWSLRAIPHLLSQVVQALAYRHWIPSDKVQAVAMRAMSPSVAYCRTTETVNLRSGGSLTHTVGVIKAFSEIAEVGYFGFDHITEVSEWTKLIVAPRRYANLVSLFSRFAYGLQFAAEVEQLVRSDYDLVYQRLSQDNISGLLLKRRLGLPLVIEYNGSAKWERASAGSFAHRLFTKSTTDLELMALKEADLVVAVSDVLGAELVSRGIDPKRTMVIPNGVEPNNFFYDKVGREETRANLGFEDDAVVVGFCGSFGDWHGVDVLADCIEKIRDAKIQFILIGDGPMRPFVEGQIGHQSNVVFLGQVPFNLVNRYLCACDMLISPHHSPQGVRFIGSPTKLFEYMATERVIIASDLEQIGEVLSPALRVAPDGASFEGDVETAVGVTVPPGDVFALVAAIRCSIKESESLAKVGANARKRVIKNYTWRVGVEAMLGRLRQLSSGS